MLPVVYDLHLTYWSLSTLDCSCLWPHVFITIWYSNEDMTTVPNSSTCTGSCYVTCSWCQGSSDPSTAITIIAHKKQTLPEYFGYHESLFGDCFEHLQCYLLCPYYSHPPTKILKNEHLFTTTIILVPCCVCGASFQIILSITYSDPWNILYKDPLVFSSSAFKHCNFHLAPSSYHSFSPTITPCHTVCFTRFLVYLSCT